jgi:hypothetical protein
VVVGVGVCVSAGGVGVGTGVIVAVGIHRGSHAPPANDASAQHAGPSGASQSSAVPHVPPLHSERHSGSVEHGISVEQKSSNSLT